MIRLHKEGNNHHTVQLNGVTMYFSYDACIAYYERKTGKCQRNPAYVKYSRTTSKHAKMMGVSTWEAAASAAAFELELMMHLRAR